MKYVLVQEDPADISQLLTVTYVSQPLLVAQSFIYHRLLLIIPGAFEYTSSPSLSCGGLKESCRQNQTKVVHG